MLPPPPLLYPGGQSAGLLSRVRKHRQIHHRYIRFLKRNRDSPQSVPRQFAVVIDKQYITHGGDMLQDMVHRIVALRGQSGTRRLEIPKGKRPAAALRRLSGPFVVAGVPDHADKISKRRALQAGERIFLDRFTAVLRGDDHSQGNSRHLSPRFHHNSIPS